MQVGELTHRLGGVCEGGAFVSTQLVRRWFDVAILRTDHTTDFAGLLAELARARAESQADRSSVSRWSPEGTRGPHSFLRDHFDYLAERLAERVGRLLDMVNAGPMLQEYLEQMGIPREDTNIWFHQNM